MLSADRIAQLLLLLNAELAADGVRGELYLAGGAVMCLVFHARSATKDIDALLVPAAELRRAAERVAAREELPPDWINDAVKGFFSESGRFDVYANYSHLQVFAPHPEYLLAMKCLAIRLGEEFRDRDDIQVLLQLLNVCAVSRKWKRSSRAIIRWIVTRLKPVTSSKTSWRNASPEPQVARNLLESNSPRLEDRCGTCF
jgi:hypothetical protein